MKIRWIGPSIDGGFHNNPLGVRRGQVLDTDGPDYLITEVSLRDYLSSHLAEEVAAHHEPKVEKAVVPEHKTETAKLDVPAKLAAVPEPLDEPPVEEEPEPHKSVPPRPVPPKRRAGR